MPHYIRFLKCPRVHHEAKGLTSVSALLTIQPDLGDSFLPEDVDLLAALSVSISASAGPNASQPTVPERRHLYRKRVAWKASDRDTKVTFGPFRFDISSCSLQLSAGHVDDYRDADTLVDGYAPSLFSAWSAVFGGANGTQAESVVERRLATATSGPLKIWEETGNSIARHIWSAQEIYSKTHVTGY